MSSEDSNSILNNAHDEEYHINYELDGSSYVVRENLVDIVQRELLGPANGEHELLQFSPRSQYLVGYIAPVKLTGQLGDAESWDDQDSLNGAVRDDLIEARLNSISPDSSGVVVDAPDESEADVEDDDVEDRVPKQGLMLPASMGLRFQLPKDQQEFTVDASWGRYERVQTDETTKSGRPITHYQRVPVAISKTLRVADLVPGRTYSVPLENSTCLRVDRYDDTEFDRVLIEIALCNDRETPIPIPTEMWMFQTQLRVHAHGKEVFLPVRDVVEHDWRDSDDEVNRLNLQYRDRLEFAIGRTCSADWVVRTGQRRATEVSTTWLPVAETPQTQAGAVAGAMMSMDELATLSASEVTAGLRPLVDGYRTWVDEQERLAETLPAHLAEIAEVVLSEANQTHKRLQAGLEFLSKDAEGFRCFQFMNAVMRDQRIATQVASRRAADDSLSIADARSAVLEIGPIAASWRPFQLAFILMQLGAMCEPTDDRRSSPYSAQVELLFFPTGGGKTEAYLGLAAFTFAIRRRQGVVTSADGPLDGNDGVAVLMRYTLRLLTAQQFQRATALVCAAELIRYNDPNTWGEEPFRIGLWVGTDVSPKRFEEADEQLTKASEFGGFRLTVLQVQRCPWCGTPIKAGNVRADKDARRIYVYCGNELAECPFSRGGAIDDGLPVLTVDEEIYRLTPSFVIATVDKFARLAREGEAASLFGYVSQRCGRHGYVHPDYVHCNIKTQHPASRDGRHPPATVRPVDRLRPPDLIIQDELHLITGALGTTVGLFEAAIETLSSWNTADGKPVKPLIVASTATVRNASDQVRALYGRSVDVFPPQVLDVADTFFSQEVPISKENPGRRYLGVSAQGVRLSNAEIRVAEVLMSAGQLLMDRAGSAADPYMTLVGYFNATRELAGMARYIADDVASRVRYPRRGSGFPRRYGTDFGQLNVAELTSRISSADIGRTLDELAVEFSSEFDGSERIRELNALRAAKQLVPKRSVNPFDVVLATSMLQVGVDVQRLGLMMVVGQPKNTAEYIQASSRVGRDSSARPGLVVSLGNWARPRDLAHFEQFRHYHETFYSQVEALSVTPYSPTSLMRGVDGVLISATRVLEATRGSDGLSPELSAYKIKAEHDRVKAVADRLAERMQLAAQVDSVGKKVQDTLTNRVDRWAQNARAASEKHRQLVYERTRGDAGLQPLMVSPENQAAVKSQVDAPRFIVPNSMREVQPEINILVSPIEERLYMKEPEGAPAWDVPSTKDETGD